MVELFVNFVEHQQKLLIVFSFCLKSKIVYNIIVKKYIKLIISGYFEELLSRVVRRPRDSKY